MNLRKEGKMHTCVTELETPTLILWSIPIAARIGEKYGPAPAGLHSMQENSESKTDQLVQTASHF